MGNGIVARGCRTIGIDSCVTDRMLKVIGGKTGLALIESFSLDSDATFENGKIFGDMKKKKVLQFSYFTQAQRQILVHLGDPMKHFSLPFLVSRANWKHDNIIYAMQWLVLTVKLPTPCRPILVHEIEVGLNVQCII
jgi:hypothetical protein